MFHVWKVISLDHHLFKNRYMVKQQRAGMVCCVIFCYSFIFLYFLPELISSWKSSVFIWPTFPSSSKTTSYKETTEEVYFQHFYTANVWQRTQCTAQNSWRAELSRLVMTNPFTKRLFIHKLFSLNIKEITDETFNHPCLLTNHAIIVQWRNFA